MTKKRGSKSPKFKQMRFECSICHMWHQPGIMHLNGFPIIEDPNCPPGKIYFINTKYFPGDEFVRGVWDDKGTNTRDT